jgi:Trk K+ transport system NAD-binding subunit
MYIVIVGGGDIGTPLIEIATRGGNEVVVIERNGTGDPITPRGTTTIEPGDIVTVYSSTGATPAVTDVFGHYDDHG